MTTKKLEITLQKRKGKTVLYALIAAFALWMMVIAVISMATGFSWSALVFGVFMAICLMAVGFALKDSNRRTPRYNVESNGLSIRFYISYAGKSNGDERVAIPKMQRFYQVTKTSRGFIRDTYFEFEPKAGIFKKKIDILPSLLQISPMDARQILQFVGEMAPEIVIGYHGSPLGRLFKK